jgi:hypothetical protein
MQSVDTVMSDRDVFLVADIIKGDTRFAVDARPVISKLNWLATLGFAPFAMDFMSPGAPPPPRPPSVDRPDFARMYASLKSRSLEVGCAVPAWFGHFPLPIGAAPVAYAGEFAEWAISRWAQETKDDIAKISVVIGLMTNYRKLQAYGRHAKRSCGRLVCRVIARLISTTYFSLESARQDPDFVFLAQIALLNWEETPDPRIIPSGDEYFGHMIGEVNERVTLWCRRNPDVLRDLLPLLPRIKGLFCVRPGLRLQEMRGIIRAVEILDQALPQSQWQEMFEWVIEETDDRRMFESFVLWGRYFAADGRIRELLKARVTDEIDRMLAGFAKLLSPREELNILFVACIHMERYDDGHRLERSDSTGRLSSSRGCLARS